MALARIFPLAFTAGPAAPDGRETGGWPSRQVEKEKAKE